MFRIRDAEAYAESPRSRRIIAAAAGPIANYLLCALTFMVAILVSGIPQPTTAIEVIPSMPAAKAGLRNGDRVVTVNGKPITAFAEMSAAVQTPGAREVALEVKRRGGTLRFVVPIRDGRIGVASMMEREAVDPLVAASAAIGLPIEHIRRFLGTLSAGAEAKFLGPVGIARMVNDLDARHRASALLLLMASYASVAWPLSILVAVLANRARRRRA